MTTFELNHRTFNFATGLRRVSRYAAVLGAAMILAASQSLAMQIDRTPGNNYPSKDELEDDGYDCEYVSTNFWVCEKDGETTYWCDSTGQCVPKPLKIGPRNPTYRFDLQRADPGAILAR